MKKYLTVLKIGIQENFEYRSEIFIYMLGWGVRLLISLYLFAAIFRQQAMIGNYDFKKIIIYFLVIQILASLNFSRTGMRISDDIQMGDFSNFLVKPMSYIMYYLTKEFSLNIVRFGISLGLFGILLSILEPEFLSLSTLMNIPLMLISTFFAYIVGSFMSMIIGILAFWIVNARRILFMYFAIMSIFSGLMIPINLFPENIQKILYYTPFPYILHVPAQVILGEYTLREGASMLLGQVIFSIILFAIVKILYSLGVKKYEAVGR